MVNYKLLFKIMASYDGQSIFNPPNQQVVMSCINMYASMVDFVKIFISDRPIECFDAQKIML